MVIETVSDGSGEIVSLAEAKEHLGVWDDQEDSRVDLLLQAARAYCEEWAEVTLRLSATRTYSTRNWPLGGWVLRRPPVTAVTSVQYYDAGDSLQTLTEGNYRTSLTAAGFGIVEYATGAVLPAACDRQDAVTITYTTGYGSAPDAPANAKAAILLVAQHLYGEDDTRQIAYAKQAAMSLLAGIAAPTYA